VREACGHSAAYPAVVAARSGDGRGAEFCTHAGDLACLNGGGNLAGVTRTVSIDIYDHVQSLEYGEANRMALVLLAISFVVLSVVYAVNRRVWTPWAAEVKRHNAGRANRKERRSAGASSFVLDVSIEVSPGITILFGASGAGKSTLLDCVAGLTRPDQGQIAAGGESCSIPRVGSMFPRRSGEPPTFFRPWRYFRI